MADLAKTLVRSVVRAFNSVQETLVVDALVTHVALIDSDLGKIMKMNMKDLHRLCASLRDQRLLVIAERSEMLEGKARPIKRTWYFIDYRQSIDAIKWRLYRCDKEMQAIARPTEEKDYSCPMCGAQWTQMEVLDNPSANGFLCHTCGGVLIHSRGQASPGHQQSARMNNQFKFMAELLPAIDSAAIPECTFDQAYADRRPIVNDSPHEMPFSTPSDLPFKPVAVKGTAVAAPKTMTVTISDNNEESTIEARKRREEHLRQNALPVWMTQSSVPTGSNPSSSTDAPAEDGSPAKKVKLEHSNGESKVKIEDDGDEDEMEFEDVM
ncbi:hypothetical protein GQ53DRAFT_753348 [Thozetella sp. PMI_491]|nr:hypothetical protein GQ53DRAFT_753348 [Thozetella sp. PMI_491]